MADHVEKTFEIDPIPDGSDPRSVYKHETQCDLVRSKFQRGRQQSSSIHSSVRPLDNHTRTRAFNM